MTPRVALLTAALSVALGMWLMLPRSHSRAIVGRCARNDGFWAIWFASLVDDRLGRQRLVRDLCLDYRRVGSCGSHLPQPRVLLSRFGLSLVGSAGLFLFQGAEFLAVATIVVYAGAILVTFLFVLMLAQPRGRSSYDRVSWDAALSAFCGAFIAGVLSTSVVGALGSPSPRTLAIAAIGDRDRSVLSPQHTARIGAELFGPYLVAVEAGGVLLLAALVGAAVIVGSTRGPLASPAGRTPPMAREPVSREREPHLALHDRGNGHA